MKKFIKTRDEETIQRLVKCGYQMVSEDKSGLCTFLNKKGKAIFDEKKVVYPDILTV